MTSQKTIKERSFSVLRSATTKRDLPLHGNNPKQAAPVLTVSVRVELLPELAAREIKAASRLLPARSQIFRIEKSPPGQTIMSAAVLKRV
tara:strand:+ start:105473 stop:105742 length:270 start_codon:yes stop_codon:yes gene_type:complete